MILADTSVWVDHFRQSVPALVAYLSEGAILSHPAVIGEIILGHVRDRGSVYRALRELRSAVVATDEEVMGLIAREQLHGIGIGWVDAHLLAATRLTGGGRLWTKDRRLHEVAVRFGVAAVP